MKRNLLVALALVCSFSLSAQEERKNRGPIDLTENLQYNVEAQASFSEGKTPLWLNANRYGLSSLDEMNGYLRAGVERPLRTDSLRRWGVGYGVDVAVPYHFTSSVVVQQAYAEARWLHGVLTVGSKQQPMELKNNRLSTGAQTLGINARPYPEVRLALPDYWAIPGTRGFLSFKGLIAWGMFTDDHFRRYVLSGFVVTDDDEDRLAPMERQRDDSLVAVLTRRDSLYPAVGRVPQFDQPLLAEADVATEPLASLRTDHIPVGPLGLTVQPQHVGGHIGLQFGLLKIQPQLLKVSFDNTTPGSL